MALIEKASAYILGILTEDETVKNFPKEFIAASTAWIRSWFLKDDPKTETKVSDPARSPENKKGLIETKLEDLLDNPEFKAALERQLTTFEQQKNRIKNVVAHSNIDAQGNVDVGDRGTSSGDDYEEKNVVKNSTIKAGRDFRLGDDTVNAGGNVHFGDVNYYGGLPGKPASANESSDFKKSMRTLISANRTEDVMPQIVDYTEVNAPHLLDEALLLSGRWDTLARKVRIGVLSNGEANVERNQIIAALLGVIGSCIEAISILPPPSVFPLSDPRPSPSFTPIQV